MCNVVFSAHFFVQKNLQSVDSFFLRFVLHDETELGFRTTPYNALIN